MSIDAHGYCQYRVLYFVYHVIQFNRPCKIRTIGFIQPDASPDQDYDSPIRDVSLPGGLNTSLTCRFSEDSVGNV